MADGDPPQEPSESSSTEDRAVILAEQAENDALFESIAAAEAQAEDALKEAALRERQEAEAARRAKRAEARAMEAARREAAAQAAARAEAERQAAMEREIQRRVEECVTQRVQEAQQEVLQVPNVFVLLGRLEQALQRTQEQEQKRLELLATMTMLLQNLQEEQQELRKVQATTLDIIGQQIGRSMPSSAAPKRQPPRARGYGAARATLAPKTADLAHDARTARSGALPRALRPVLQLRQPQRAKGGRMESLLARAEGCCRRSGKRTWPNPSLRSRRRGQSARSQAPRQPGGRRWAAVAMTGRAMEVVAASQWRRLHNASFGRSAYQVPCASPATPLRPVPDPFQGFQGTRPPGLPTLGAHTPLSGPDFPTPGFPLCCRLVSSFVVLHPVGGVVPIPFRWQPALTLSFRTLVPDPLVAPPSVPPLRRPYFSGQPARTQPLGP